MTDFNSTTNGFDRMSRNWRYRDDGARWLNVAFIGYGNEGEILCDDLCKIPNVRIVAVCDIWPYRHKLAQGRLRAFGHSPIALYEDYGVMLKNEAKNIDVVFVATPDFCHGEQVRAALCAGMHVYCSAPLSHSLTDANKTVREYESSGKIMQVGYVRRSNPRYRHAIEDCVRGERLLGRVTHAVTQSHRAVSSLWGVQKKFQPPLETLQRYGYANMEEFIHWRWFPSYSAGQLMTLGVYGLDVCLWAWDCEKVSAIAVGGNDYYHRAVNEDGVALFEFVTKDRQTARACCHVINTSSLGGTYEELMGEHGSLRISPIAMRGNAFKRELDANVPSWYLFEKRGDLIGPNVAPEIAIVGCESTRRVVVGTAPNLDTYGLPGAEGGWESDYCHVANFIQAIRHENPSIISCPPTTALRTEKAMFAACESLTTKCRVTVEL